MEEIWRIAYVSFGVFTFLECVKFLLLGVRVSVGRKASDFEDILREAGGQNFKVGDKSIVDVHGDARRAIKRWEKKMLADKKEGKEVDPQYYADQAYAEVNEMLEPFIDEIHRMIG